VYTVQIIDSNANNLMSHHSSVVAYRDQNICPRCFFSRVSSSSRNIIRPTAGASHISVWRYARDIEISLHRKFRVRCIRRKYPAYRQTVSARHRESSFRTRKAITRFLNGLRQDAVSGRVLRDIYLIFSWETKDDLKRPVILYCYVVVISTSWN